MILGGNIMGMSSSARYLLLDEDQYQKLKKKELYIKSNCDLELISAAEAENYKKALEINPNNTDAQSGLILAVSDIMTPQELIKYLPTFVDYTFKVYKRNNQNKNIKAGDIEAIEV